MAEKGVYDVLIAGGGPAGSACALCLADTGLSIAVVDKATFPRNKICGDALSVDVIRQLPKISDKLPDKLSKEEKKITSSGLRLYGPSGELLELDLETKDHECGYVMRRPLFDQILYDSVKEIPSVHFMENQSVISVEKSKDHISLITAKQKITGKILIGADGANSVVARYAEGHQKIKKHLCVGIKSYYKNVGGLHSEGHIELHFYKELLPCYLWIFPMHNNEANVGLGLMHHDLVKAKKSLKRLMFDLIENHPNLSGRFKNAELISPVEAWPLPLGMNKKNISDERILLTGDAAGLIDPFTGEGVGNALRSGRIAADHVLKCFAENKFSAKFNKDFDQEIYRRMWNELRISKSMQQIVKHPKLIDMIIRKTNKSAAFRKLMLNAMLNEAAKESIVRQLLKK